MVGSLKCNIDTSLFPWHGYNCGRFLSSMAMKFDGLYTSEEVEAHGFRESSSMDFGSRTSTCF